MYSTDRQGGRRTDAEGLDGNVVGFDLVRVHVNVGIRVRAQAALNLESDADALM
jgi:hypothetical protein